MHFAPVTPLKLDDFDYALPSDLIAQHPAAERASSRLLCVTGDALHDGRFSGLPRLIERGDLLVFNDTRVIKARLLGRKDTGGRVEALIERVLDAREALAQVRSSHAPRPGTRLAFGGAIEAEVVARHDDLYRLRFFGDAPLAALLERHGAVPLPPYIARPPAAEDERRYQTVYARSPGAAAAPTAGLHFDEPLLAALSAAGVESAFLTLHVGAGTFQPVRSQDLSQHRMHAERYEIPAQTAAAVAAARERGKRVIAVGTTSVRALEASAARHGEVVAGAAETDLFITPGYAFRVVDRLLTNFHLPKSTLLILVSAFAGLERVRAAYRHAIRERYRFFSYGDAMLVDRMPR
ncbi:MAG: tRNA preQ1(34) S-adenosylmethionine ribosyltransferase-isomerase QueA [Betaproteobacteria bacterium]|nr:tRNA preQ1(34) S-adenosylmethionine ribosyltransferase-isomerase QueA [Betaproteobacteria bacterium]MBI2962091.1 tRNA preQ1(34) S-adenosylmethionine ribosyltransferase-isomerase QueA [Betaproteobacteria bacterium]